MPKYLKDDSVKKRSIKVQGGEGREESSRFKGNKHVFSLRSINGKVVSRDPRSDRVNIGLNERNIGGRITLVGKKNVVSIKGKFR